MSLKYPPYAAKDYIDPSKEGMVIINSMNSMQLFIILFLIVLPGCGKHYISSRSPLRKSITTPKIVVSESNSSQSYARTSIHYKEDPIFTIFDAPFFYKHQIPKDGITYPQGDGVISHDAINEAITRIVDAVMADGLPLPGCSILRDSNFNYATKCGLLIVKLEAYPLVIKLFRETAHSFVQPLSKGLEPTSSFFMAGGSNRHITGLSRIPNRSHLLSIIENHPYWQSIVEIPRKWYWSPPEIDWLIIDGYHFKTAEHLQTKIPALYAVVADYMEVPIAASVPPETQEEMIMDLCCTCALHLDPHLKNYIVYQPTPDDHPKIIIVDTEDHQCMTGLNGNMTCSNYIAWYILLGSKFLCDAVFHIKT